MVGIGSVHTRGKFELLKMPSKGQYLPAYVPRVGFRKLRSYPKGTSPNQPAYPRRVRAPTYLVMDIHVAEGDISGHNTTMVLRHPPKNTPLTRDSG
jgi:hypothetical protein